MKAKEQQPEQEILGMIPKDEKFELPRTKSEEEIKMESSAPRRADSPRSMSRVVFSELISLQMDENRDYGFERQEQLWEYTDSCLFLLRELSNSSLKTEVQKYLYVLPELGLLD